MTRRQPSLPPVWLVSDQRNDAVLEKALLRLPRGSGLVFRHHHLAPEERKRRFAALDRIARARGHLVVLSGPAREARRRGAHGSYGQVQVLAHGPAILRLVTAHDLREIGQARRARANAILLSPVFATRTHPEAPVLGGVRFRLLARRSDVPVIALGGMTRARAHRLAPHGWAAIDGLSS